jgi:methanol metabolism-related c-type cytochrome
MLSRGFRLVVVASAFLLGIFLITADRSQAQDSSSTAAASDEEKPYKIEPDGTVDWATFSGFRRFNSECFVCHGPDGVGSTFAPALVDSLKTMSYEQFLDIVTNGKTEVNTAVQKKMPTFGTNPNVMCYIDDIYAYLKARSDGALGRGRPAKHQPKSAEAKAAEDACMGTN